MKDRLVNYFRAGYPGVAIQTTEEQRAVAEIMVAAEEVGCGVRTWSVTEGLRQIKPELKEFPDTQDLVSVLLAGDRENDCIYIYRDLQTWPLEQSPLMLRAIRDLLRWAPSAGSNIVFVGPSFKSHPTYEKQVVVLDYGLPGRNDLEEVASKISKSADKKLDFDDEIAQSLSGLSVTEAENALSLSYIESGDFIPKIIYREKIQAVKKSGLLEIIDPDPRGVDGIGGLEVLKEWVQKRTKVFTPEAREFGLPLPKGVLLVGVPGTGKSLTAKSIGTVLNIPTLRLDMGSLFNSLVGETESRTRQALNLAEAISPCVLWVDEIDKGLAGSSGSGAGDSGTTKRVFGTVVTWLQERTKPVFLVATANDVTYLPPEFLRKGRFDEIWAIDLPNPIERAQIFKIHLERHNMHKEVTSKDIEFLCESTDGFTGSEIEAVIIDGMFTAFYEGRKLCAADVEKSIKETTPLSKTAREQIDAIRKWSKTRARLASTTFSPQLKQEMRVIK